MGSRLELRDVPKDKGRALAAFRQAIVTAFNYCRKSPERMATLKSILKYVHNRISQYEKEEEATNKDKLEAKAALLGIDLDKRATLATMQEEFTLAQAKLEATTEGEE